jgi:hypothetical protein
MSGISCFESSHTGSAFREGPTEDLSRSEGSVFFRSLGEIMGEEHMHDMLSGLEASGSLSDRDFIQVTGSIGSSSSSSLTPPPLLLSMNSSRSEAGLIGELESLIPFVRKKMEALFDEYDRAEPGSAGQQRVSRMFQTLIREGKRLSDLAKQLHSINPARAADFGGQVDGLLAFFHERCKSRGSLEKFVADWNLIDRICSLIDSQMPEKRAEFFRDNHSVFSTFIDASSLPEHMKHTFHKRLEALQAGVGLSPTGDRYNRDLGAGGYGSVHAEEVRQEIAARKTPHSPSPIDDNHFSTKEVEVHAALRNAGEEHLQHLPRIIRNGRSSGVVMEKLNPLFPSSHRPTVAETVEVTRGVLKALRSLNALLSKPPTVVESGGAIPLYRDDEIPPVVHRDIKKANILRRPDGDVVLCDFGLVAHEGEECQRTKGTPFLVPPEGFKPHVIRSNIDSWAIGILIFQLLSGEAHPFASDNAYTLMFKVSDLAESEESRGAFRDLLLAKQGEIATAHGAVPGDDTIQLLQLMVDLLEPDPSIRMNPELALARIEAIYPE